MTKLFNKEDILTILTADKAKIGDNGYFGGSLARLATEVEHGEVHVLAKIYDDDYTLYPFKGDHHADYFAFFLPIDRVKNKVKEPVYRPIKTIDELYNFLVSSVVDDYNNTLDKVGVIFSSVFELKGKNSGYIYYKKFTSIRVTDDGIVLDAFTLDHYFENYEIKQNGEFIPFGILEE